MKAKDAERIQHESVMASRYIFASPNPAKTFIITAFIIPPYFFIINLFWKMRMELMPVLAAIMLSYPLILHLLLKKMKRISYIRRWAFLNFFNIGVAMLSISFLLFLSMYIPIKFSTASMMVLSTIIFYNSIIYRSVCSKTYGEAYFFGTSHAIVSSLPFIPSFNATTFLSSIGIAFLISMLFFFIISQPFKKSFGKEPFTLLQASLEQFASGKKGETIENFFDMVGNEHDAKAKIILLKGGDSCALILPNIHPGPYGKLGGARLTEMIHKSFEEKFEGSVKAVVFHSATSNDENPARNEYARIFAERVAAGMEKIMDGNGFKNAGKFVRVRKGEIKFILHDFGKHLLMMYTSAPLPTDDIEAEVGRKIEREMEKYGYESILFIDCHNSLEPGTGRIFHGSEKEKNIISFINSEEMRKAIDFIGKRERIKFSCHQMYLKGGDIGNAPLSIILIESADGKRIAYIVFDGNNMVRGLREKIVKAGERYADICEVMTTDSHSVNVKIGGYRPIGSETPHDKIIRAVEEGLKVADKKIRNEGYAEIFYGEINCGKIRIFGKGNTKKLTEKVEETISMLPWLYLSMNAILILLLIIIALSF